MRAYVGDRDEAVQWEARVREHAAQRASKRRFDREKIRQDLRKAVFELSESSPHFYHFQPPSMLGVREIEQKLDQILADVLAPPIGALASTVVKHPVEWLWPKYIPLGHITDFQGDPANFKSGISIHLAACTTTDKPWPDGSYNAIGPSGVVLLSAEDDAGSTIRPRLELAGANLDVVVIVPLMIENKEGSRPLTLPDDLLLLEETALRYRERRTRARD